MQVFDEKYKKLIEEFNKGKTMVLSTAVNVIRINDGEGVFIEEGVYICKV